MEVRIPTASGFNPFGGEDASRDRVFASGKDFEYETCANDFTMKRCAATGLLYLDPRPAPDQMMTIYPTDYLPYRFDTLPAPVRAARDFVQKSKVNAFRKLVPADAKIVDIGCGNGTLLKLMRRFGEKTWDLHGHDFRSDVLADLPKAGIHTHSGSLAEMGGGFDLVILNQVIEHVPDVRLFLRELRAILKPGGKLFIETPNTDSVDGRLFAKRYWGGYHFPRHWTLFTPALLERLLQEEGFTTDAPVFLTSPSFWVQSVHHFFSDKGMRRTAGLFQGANPLAMGFFTLVDLALLRLGFRTSNMRVVATRKAAS